MLLLLRLRDPLRRVAARGAVWLHKEAAAATAPTATTAKTAPDTDYLQKILTARVYDVAHETPLQPARILSQELGNNVFLKREDTQDVFSFKIRGAYNRMASLSAAERERGVVTCSAGNHAQGVALAAKKLGIDVTIVMPTTTPEIKVDSVRSRGARVLLYGDSFQEAAVEAQRIQAHEERVLVHPYDCPLVIAGQGTIGMEIMKQATDVDVIFCPVGGGGLIAGVAAYVKRVRPSVKVIGVEASDSAGMSAALEAGERVTLSHVGTFADGTAVKQVGVETFRLCSQFVDDMITVDTDQICAALKDFFVETRSILEPSGALAVAGLREYVQRSRVRGANLVAVASGANMDFSRLRYVAERAEAQEKMLAIRIPERPGSFNRLYELLRPRDITAFSYRYASTLNAEVYVSFRSAGDNDVNVVIESLESAGLQTLDLSQNELAKVHGRYLVGGRCPQIENELLYRFEFPERPGALGKFLSSLNAGWNVSLFHYKQAGGDVGHVLAGLQVPTGEHDAFQRFLEGLRYPYTNESTNKLYERFLS